MARGRPTVTSSTGTSHPGVDAAGWGGSPRCRGVPRLRLPVRNAPCCCRSARRFAETGSSWTYQWRKNTFGSSCRGVAESSPVARGARQQTISTSRSKRTAFFSSERMTVFIETALGAGPVFHANFLSDVVSTGCCAHTNRMHVQTQARIRFDRYLTGCPPAQKGFL